MSAEHSLGKLRQTNKLCSDTGQNPTILTRGIDCYSFTPWPIVAMAKTDRDAGGFEFDPDQLGELGELAEAFIHQEVDVDFFDKLDRDYLEQLILYRMDATDY